PHQRSVRRLARKSLTEGQASPGVTQALRPARFIVELEAKVEIVPTPGPIEIRLEIPGIVGRPTDAAAAEQRTANTIDVDIRDHRTGDSRRVDHTGHANRLRRDLQRLIVIPRRQLREPEIVGPKIEQHGW